MGLVLHDLSMHKPHFTQEQLAQIAKLSDSDIKRVNENRGTQNKLGFAYQLCYVKLFNRLPTQSNFEPVEELATFVAVQLDIARELLPGYAQKSTFLHHQEDLCSYLHLEKFNENTEAILETHLFQQALQIQPTESLFIKAREFLKERRTLNPSDDTIERLIQTQREKARKYILEKIYKDIAPPIKLALDDLFIVGTESYSKLYQIKEVPQKPSAAAIKALANKLVMIEQTGVLTIKLDWLNNNYKRYFSQYVIHADANKLGELTPLNRYASLVCFLQEAYRDTIDHIFDMYQKAISTMYNQADKTVDTYNKTKRATTRSCLTNHKKLCGELLAVAEGTADIEALFKKYPDAYLQAQIEEVEDLLTSKYSHNLNVVADRFSHMRQLAKPLLEKLTLELASTGNDSLVTALQIVREIIQGTRRSVPDNTNLDFLPKTVRQAVKEDGGINRRRYEAAVFTALRDHIKCGNLAITGSKRFGKLEDFFISPNQWEAIREEFFKKNKLPQNPKDVPLYFESRLNKAFEYFLQREKNNMFAKIGKEGWELSKDPTEEFTPAKKQKLEALVAWLSEHMRTIKLPDLLIEVDNDLHFTNDFLPAAKRNERNSNDICNILTTIMAYGCNIGPHIMAQMITGISYQQIKHMFDWQLTDDAHRIALADVVNGIGSIEITKVWGEGKTAGADGQRFGYRRKTLQRTFSHKFNDFAIEFYIFVADNYAPFYNLVKEATDRDSSKVLDGYLYATSTRTNGTTTPTVLLKLTLPRLRCLVRHFLPASRTSKRNGYTKLMIRKTLAA
jgi:hypothetical protein